MAMELEMSVFIPVSKKSNAKECSNYCPVALISHASKVMLKILQARLQQYVNQELPDVQAGFRKGRGTSAHYIHKFSITPRTYICIHILTLEKEMATHSSVLAWRIPGTGEPGGLPSMGSHRVGHD